MSAEREVMLNRVRQSLRGALLPAASASLPPRVFSPAPGDTAALKARFLRELEAVGGEASEPATRAEACARVVQLIQEAGADEVLSWPEEEVRLPGLNQALQAAGLRPVSAALGTDPADRRAQLAALGRPLAGLTGALAGLADTGSLALLSGPARSRAASLLPLVHIAVLRVDALLPSMPHFFAAYPGLTREASNLVFITGPSRTADIEMVITRGVHGPRRLHVVLWPG